MTAAVTMIDAGMLDFGHLGSVVHFDGANSSLDGMVLIRVSHEKRFRVGTFIGLTSVEEYERDLAGNGTLLQRTGIFLPKGAGIKIELDEDAVRPKPGTAGASVWENVGKEAFRPNERPWRGDKSDIIDHYLGEGTSFIYSDKDGMLDPDTFHYKDRIDLA